MEEAFEERDLRRIEEYGIDVEEARRQLGLLRNPPPFAQLVRPCTRGDGICVLSAQETPALEARQGEAAGAGRFQKFVPASGAASRMFKALQGYLAGGGEPGPAVREFLAGLERFAFFEDLDAVLAAGGAGARSRIERGEVAALIAALLGVEGLGYGALPKGLLAFHRYGDSARTPFEEHLVEAAHCVRDRNGLCRLHLTVAPEHRGLFEQLLAERRSLYEERFGVRFEVSYSAQKPSTDTLSIDGSGAPFRLEDGSLLLRPGGHGALIENLADLHGDLVYIKNIDNVLPEHRAGQSWRWKRILGGLALALEEESHAHLARLSDEAHWRAALAPARAFLCKRLGFELPGGSEEVQRRALLERLERPLRVCGMVRNEGQPGGGPFWVRGRDGAITTQIVEAVQVDPEDSGQRDLLAAATHFNPVDLVCAVRDRHGEPYDLRAYVDGEAVFLAEKSHGAAILKALERPGLWNGAMAGWNTVFVEVPAETFAPVKTVCDLLRVEHQPPA